MFPSTKTCRVIIFSLAFCLSPLRAADAETPPKTLDEQITYLEGALSESYRLRDRTMLDMAVKGLKAAKLAEKDLEISILRSERNAAWASGQQFGTVTAPAASIEAWGLMTRAKMGQDAALQSLRKLAGDLPPNPGVLPAMTKDNAAEYQAKQIAINEYAARAKLHGQAMLALALLKEPGIEAKALSAIQNKSSTDHQAMMMGMYGGGADPLILAVLEADGEAGLTKLLAYCSDEKAAVKDQASVLNELNSLVSPMAFLGAEDKFSVTAEIRKKLPKDTQKKLTAPYASILKRYAPDPNQQWDMALNTISNIGMALPANSLDADTVEAMNALVGRLPGDKNQYPKPNFIAIMKKNGKDFNLPSKPPKPPVDDKQF